MTAQQEYYTTSEAATVLGITVGAVRKAIQQGRLSVTRLGGGEQRAGLVLISAAEVARYRDEHPLRIGRPKAGTDGHHIRVVEELAQSGSTRMRIFIGKGLWRALGQPDHIAITADPLMITPATGDDGYALVVGDGVPRCFITKLSLQLGTYEAEISDGKLVARWIGSQ